MSEQQTKEQFNDENEIKNYVSNTDKDIYTVAISQKK